MDDEKKGDTRVLQNWRPISLLNADAKLLSSIFVQRLALFNKAFLKKSQIGFVKGELIQKNVWTIDQVMRHASAKNISGAVVFLDQEKAYDRVSHDYMFRLFDEIGLNNALKKWL